MDLHFFGSKTFGPEIFFGQRIFWIKNHFGVKIVFNHNFVLDQNCERNQQAGAELGQSQPKLGLELGLLKFIFVPLNW